MGKFVRVSSNNSSESSKYMDEIMFHVAREELSLNPNDKVIGKTILKILNTEVCLFPSPSSPPHLYKFHSSPRSMSPTKTRPLWARFS
jgi:hypothetical protein